LFPAVTRCNERSTDYLRDRTSHGTQHLVACQMTMRVVERLEVINVKYNQRAWIAARRADHALVQLKVKRPPISETGQCIRLRIRFLSADFFCLKGDFLFSLLEP